MYVHYIVQLLQKMWWWPSELLWLLSNLAPMKHQEVSNILNVKSSKALTLCFTHQNHHYIRENLISLRTTKQCNVRQKQQLVRWQRRERLNCSEANPSPSARARDQTTADSQSCQLATTSADSKTSADSETIADSKITTDCEIADCWLLPLETIFLQSCLRNFDKIYLHPLGPKSQEDGFKNPPGFCLPFGHNHRRQRDIFWAAGSTNSGMTMMTMVLVVMMMFNVPGMTMMTMVMVVIMRSNCPYRPRR